MDTKLTQNQPDILTLKDYLGFFVRMGKDKLRKFEAIGTFPNVFQNTSWHQPNCTNNKGENLTIKGQWNDLVFQNEKPIVVELACGKGEYTLALAQKCPQYNYIGIDLKGNRIWKGAQKAQELNLTNVHFLRTRIELLAHFFALQEISEIWITFPDPHLREVKAQKRLTSERFLNIYKPLLKPKAPIQLKTDSIPLYQFTKTTIKQLNLELLADYSDIYSIKDIDDTLTVKTYYEKKHLANDLTIMYLKFCFKT